MTMGFWIQERAELEQLDAQVFVPLWVKEMLVGVLAVGPRTSEQAYSTEDVSTLVTLANQMAVAVENARLYDAMERELVERRRAEERVRASLQEKEVLLREVHHRVKNNLQVVSGLLSLQVEYVEDPQVAEILKDSQDRIRAMAMIHEKLLLVPTLARVELKEYIEDLTKRLGQSYHADVRGIQLTVTGESVHVGLDTAVPCALILTELITNAFKHAFTPQQRGHVWIDLRRKDQSLVALNVRDDGAGLPAAVDVNTTGSLGLLLVQTLVQQLGGEIEAQGGQGTTFRITFSAH
jgi:two-component sensor histidine kinase